ncbi:MAG: GAF domain-containing protein, partial [Oligoflexia bacterium]|nr:GAF domain-containing protein [Oligoflexia bacterium]
NEFLNDAAIACELATNFYFGNADERIAKTYLKEALFYYDKWGAKLKHSFLINKYKKLIEDDNAIINLHTTLKTPNDNKTDNDFDINSLMQASVSISEEMKLNKLLQKIMDILIRNTGAQKGILLVNKDDTFFVESIGIIGLAENQIQKSISIDTLEKEYENCVSGNKIDNEILLPLKIINYVIHSCEQLVINDVSKEEKFLLDPYIQKYKPKSILCSPLIKQGKIVSLAYLENNLSADIFTTERIKVVTLLSSQAVTSIENAIQYERVKELNIAYEKFVPKQFLNFLHREDITKVNLGDHIERVMSVLFTDIRDFTTLSESMSPQENFDFLNEFLRRCSPLIRTNEGFIDKYIGDAIMALFPKKSDDAINSAIKILKTIREYNSERIQKSELPINIGIGIHTGNLMLGTIGEDHRMESTVISDTVNLASRVEGLTKIFGVSLIITETTLKDIENINNYNIRFLGRSKVKGKSKSIDIYEIFSADIESLKEKKLASKQKFEEALNLYYKKDFSYSMNLFKEVLNINAKDHAAHFYYLQAKEKLSQSVDDEWEADTFLQK